MDESVWRKLHRVLWSWRNTSPAKVVTRRRAPNCRRIELEPLEDRRLLSIDFGDAPAPYPTLLSNDGARHEIAGPRLGALVDAEVEGLPSLLADGDDLADSDDEDGVTFGTIQVGQLDASVIVNVQNAPAGAKLDAWIDFNGDGSWGGPFEHIADSVTVVNGDNTITFDVPSWAASGDSCARFRLSSAGDLALTGPAGDGEVEDSLVAILPPNVSRGRFVLRDPIAGDCESPSSILAIDLDGDSDVDILSASSADDRIAWYENDGNGKFAAHTISSFVLKASSVFAADLDGDGDLDVLAASRGYDKIQWFENDGEESFFPHPLAGDLDGILSVSAADMDNDGDMDVLSASSLDRKIAWHENDGFQNFSSHTITTMYTEPWSVSALDMDGDGDQDVLSTADNLGMVLWHENLGDGTFTSYTIFSDIYSDPVSAFGVDMDRDGDMDVLSGHAESGKIIWHENDGSAGFTSHPITVSAIGVSSIFAADVDGDTDIDVLWGSPDEGKVGWYENDGDQAFAVHTITDTTRGLNLLVVGADFDGDGDTDALSASSEELYSFDEDHAVVWYENHRNDTFTSHAVSVSAADAKSVFAADIDSDGDMDVLSASRPDNTIAWYENDGNEYFTPHTISASASRAESVFAVDLDGDGDMDVLSASYGGEIAWYDNDGYERFDGRTISTSALGADVVLAADMDCDGDMDVLFSSRHDNTIAWCENDGNQDFSVHVISESGDYVRSVTAVDVDGDRDIDVCASGPSGKLAWYENDGQQSFTIHTISVSDNSTQSVFAADVDRDGDMDLLSVSFGGTIAWFENDGTQEFVCHTIVTSSERPAYLFASDMDGDGDIDVLAGSTHVIWDAYDGRIAWYENDGLNSFTRHVIFPSSHRANSVIAADVDDDGDLDVLSASSDGRVCWLENLNEPADFTINESNGSTSVCESGTTDAFAISLTEAPLSDVVIWITASGPDEVTVDKSVLTFTRWTWNNPTIVTVEGVDDTITDGNQLTTITLSIDDASSDPAFHLVGDKTVLVTTTDNDAADFTVTETGGTSVSESITTDTFTVVINAEPLTNVVITVTIANTAEAAVDKTSLTFTPANWNQAQTVTVTGVDDTIVDGSQLTTITVSIDDANSDPAFHLVGDKTVIVTTTDDDHFDFGDAPAPYATTLGDNGARHVTIGPTLGSTRDWEIDGSPSTAADADDTTGSPDDEDGVVFKSELIPGRIASVDVITSAAGILNAWVDFNDDGDWADLGEQIFIDEALSAGLNNRSFAVPADAVLCPQTFARFRFSSVGGLSYDGAAPDGEVEDYASAVVPPLTLVIDTESISESAGPAAATATVTRNTGTVGDLVVELTSSDTSEATVPTTITIPDGATSATFTLDAEDDSLVDGSQTVTLTATTYKEVAQGLDPTFGSAGLASLPVKSVWGSVNGSLAQQPDGKTIVAVDNDMGVVGNYAWQITRVNPDGTIDPTFGTNGVVRTALPVSSLAVAEKVLIQPDGKFLVGGIATRAGIGTGALARYNADGSLDTSFGSNGLADLSGVAGWIVDMTLRPNGRILLGLGANGIACLRTLQLNPDGSRDTTFGSDGSVVVSVNDSLCAVIPAGNGRIVLVGDHGRSARLNADGSLDTSYGTDGFAFIREELDPMESFHDATMDSSGRILLSGKRRNEYDDDIIVARINADGSLDTSFGVNGIVVTGVAGQYEWASCVVVQADGRIVLAGGTTPPDDVLVVRLNEDGSLDTSFDGDGRYQHSVIPDSAEGTADILLQDDGRLLGLVGKGSDLYIARYNLESVWVDAQATDTLIVDDDDTANLTIVQSEDSTGVSETGTTDTFTVVLNAAPLTDVVITVSSADTGEATVAPATLTFTPANWNQAQTVTVTGVDDAIADGNQLTTITLAIDDASSDPAFHLVGDKTVLVTTTDDDTAGITVLADGHTTSEGGGTVTVTVKLDSEPTDDVTITVASSDPTEGSVSKPALIFTAGDWNQPQTVTITGVDDDVQDGNIGYAVTSLASSGDPNYQGRTGDAVAVTNEDDDTAGITALADGHTTTEGGGTVTVTVRLDSEPTGDVTITLSSSDPTEGAVSKPALTFTAANWNQPQTVTITGVDDDVEDGDIGYTITTLAVSQDPNYQGRTGDAVAVTNEDDDTAGITALADGHTTTEGGGTVTVTVKLDSEPTGDVTITLASSDPTEGSVSKPTLTFTAGDWNQPQTVTITGVDDDVQDGNIAYTITTLASSQDPNYQGRTGDAVVVTNQDNDQAGIRVLADSHTTTEGGGTVTVTVKLDSEPTDDVTITLTSSDPSEGALSKPTLTFTPGDWNQPQTVTITGVDDDVQDGNIAYTITTLASSQDPNYQGRAGDAVAVTNEDNDQAGITVLADGHTTAEGGGTVTVTVRLDSEPTDDVTITLTSSDPSEGTLSKPTLTFTAGDWNQPQTVTITGVDDDVQDGNIGYTVTSLASSQDANYQGRTGDALAVTNEDNDTAGITVLADGHTTTEGGGTVTVTVKLDSEPTDDVTITLVSSDPSEGALSKPALTFTAGNWNQPQTVTITGVDDAVDDGDIGYTVTSLASSGDPNYQGRAGDSVAVTNEDNDTAGITVLADGHTTTEGGGTVTVTVKLDSEPADDVTITLVSSDPSEGALSKPALTFTAGDWNQPQTVTITGVDDDVQDGNIGYTVTTLASSQDPNYQGRTGDDVAVTNEDNDTAGITVLADGHATTEGGGQVTVTVKLDSEPTDDVTITLTSSDPSEGVVSKAALTFAAGDWNQPQTLTITGVDDDVQDGNIGYTVTTLASSQDPNYQGRTGDDVAVTNEDNDTAGITVLADGHTTTEGGGTVTVTVKLDSEPTHDVTITLTSSDPSEGVVSKPTLTFTAGNWNQPQTVTVTGVDDAVDDGDIGYTVTSLAASQDPNYQGRAGNAVAVTNEDNDTGGITVLADGHTTTEGGGTITVTVKLDSEPTDDVTITLTSSDPSEGALSKPTLTFTAGDWNQPQTLTIMGVDDDVQDGNIGYTITSLASSQDPNYQGRSGEAVAVTNEDNDQAGITVLADGHTTSEGGGTVTVTVRLDSEPTGDVTITLVSSDPSEGGVSKPTLTFTDGDWNQPQTVTITGVDDDVEDGDIGYTITTLASSGDPNYQGRAGDDVAVTNADNDQAGITVLADGHTTSEGGGTVTVTVRLDSEPTHDVTITLTSSDPSEGALSKPTLTFTAGDWNQPQTLTIMGVDDDVQDGNIGYTITSLASSQDPNYQGRAGDAVAVTNEDNDTAGITVLADSHTTTEGGGTITVTVKLDSEPTDDVTITLTSSDPSEGALSKPTLTFTAGDWNQPQTLTITGVDDDVDDGDVSYTVVTAAAISADPNYGNLDAEDVEIVNVDDDETVDLGLVDFRQVESVTPGEQGLWFRLETAHEGWLTVQSAGSWSADQLTFGLYAPTDLKTPLAVSQVGEAMQRFDHGVGQGQVYLLRVTGSASNATLLLTNLVHKAGSAVTVYGTDQDDVFVFDAGASREIAINGVTYHYEDTQVSTVGFAGGSGRDMAWLYDSAGNESLEAWPDRAALTNGTGDAVQDYLVEVSGIEDLLAYATRGGTDSAVFHGSAGNDKFKSYEEYVRLRAVDSRYTLRAKKFDTIVGDTGSGGKDLAVFNGSDGNDTFTYRGADNSTRLEGKRRDHTSTGFRSVIAYSGGGENDVAYFTDTPKTQDIFYLRSHKAQLVGEDVKITARTFDHVYATASEGGFDIVRIYDTAGDEHLEVAGDTARLYRRNGTELDLLYEAIGFERVKAHRTQGNDTTDIGEHTMELLFYGWDV